MAQSVEVLMSELRKAGVLSGGPTNPMGLPMPSGFDGYFLEDELLVPPSRRPAAHALATSRGEWPTAWVGVGWGGAGK